MNEIGRKINMITTNNEIGGAMFRAPFKTTSRTTEEVIAMPITRRQFMNMRADKIGYYKSTVLAVTDLIIGKCGGIK